MQNHHCVYVNDTHFPDERTAAILAMHAVDKMNVYQMLKPSTLLSMKLPFQLLHFEGALAGIVRRTQQCLLPGLFGLANSGPWSLRLAAFVSRPSPLPRGL